MAQTQTQDDLLTASAAARLLGRAAVTVRLYAAQGALPVAARSTTGVRLFRRADVEALAARLHGGTAAA